MKEIDIRATVEFSWVVDDDVEITDELINRLIGYEHEAEVIAEVQNECTYMVYEDEEDEE